MMKRLLALLTLLPLTASAQNVPPPPNYIPPSKLNPPRVEIRRPSSTDNGQDADSAVRFDLDFPGGSPQTLIDAISKAAGQPVNAIIPKNGRDFEIPSFQVYQVTVGELLLSLKAVDIEWGRRGNNGRHAYDVGYYWEVLARSKENPIWVMHVEKLTESPIEVQAVPIPIAELLENYSIDDISTAIQLVWDVPGDDTDVAKLKYHPETQLLILQGTIGQIKSANQVLETLSKMVDQKAITSAISGDVRNPSQYKFKEAPTLTEAFYRAGGSPQQTVPATYLIYDSSGESILSQGSFTEVLAGEAEDLRIEPGQNIQFRKANATRRRVIERGNSSEFTSDTPSETSKSNNEPAKN